MCVCMPLSSLQFIDHSLKEYLSNTDYEPGSVLDTWATKREHSKPNSPPTWWRPTVKHAQNNIKISLDFNARGKVKQVKAIQRDEASEVLFWGEVGGRKGLSDEVIFEERPGYNARLSPVEMGAGLPVIGKRGDDGIGKIK